MATANRKRQPGPNDFHFTQNESGVQVLQPGLGSDEPDDMTKERVEADAKANFERQQILDQEAERLRTEGDKIERAQEKMDEREAELLRRERSLREREEAIIASTAAAPAAERSGEPKPRRQTTDRAE